MADRYNPTEPLEIVNPRYFLRTNEGKSNRGVRSQFRIMSGLEGFGDDLQGSEAQLFKSLSQPSGQDNGNGMSNFSYFLLQNISISQTEKSQIFDLFGDNYVVYYLGRNPTTVSIDGVTIDDVENNWWYRFMTGYQNFLRGTSTATSRTLVEFITCNMQVIGTIMNLSTNQNSARDTDISFGMQILVKTITFIPVAGVNDIGSLRNTLSNSYNNTTSIPTKAQNEINSLKISHASDAAAYTQRGTTNSQANQAATLVEYRTGDSGYELNSLRDPLNNSSYYSLSPIYSSGYDNNIYRNPAELRQTIWAIPGYAQDVIRGIRSIRNQLFSIASIPLGFLSRINNEIKYLVRGPQEILREIQGLNVGIQGLIGEVYNQIAEPANTIGALTRQFNATNNNLRKTAGLISHIPRTMAEEIKYLYSSGKIRHPGALIRGSGSGTAGINAAMTSIPSTSANEAARL